MLKVVVVTLRRWPSRTGFVLDTLSAIFEEILPHENFIFEMLFVLKHLLNSFSVFLLDSLRSAQNVVWCNEGQNFAALAYIERHLMRAQLKFDTITA